MNKILTENFIAEKSLGVESLQKGATNREGLRSIGLYLLLSCLQSITFATLSPPITAKSVKTARFFSAP